MASLVASLRLVRLVLLIWVTQFPITKDSMCAVELHKVIKIMVMATARTATVMTWMVALRENVARRMMSMAATLSAATAQRLI